MITADTTLLELAGLVSRALRQTNLEAVLSGGAAVSTYTNNEYESADLDFVCSAQMSVLEQALGPLGGSSMIEMRLWCVDLCLP